MLIALVCAQTADSADILGIPTIFLPSIKRSHLPGGFRCFSGFGHGAKTLFPKYLLPAVTLMALLWSGCGGGKSSTSTTTGVNVTISPTTASIAGGATQQFTATVTGSTNTAVTWQVNGTTGGDAIVGTVSATGLYTAPTGVATTTSVAVTATSSADTTKTASAAVTLTVPTVTISILPTNANVPAGGTVQFTANVTSADNNTQVTWSITGCSTPAICGTVSATGLYTAPASPPRSSITVTATSKANTAFSASAPITVQFSNASLKGNYVFLATQNDNTTGSAFAFRAGQLVADGAGQLTSGVNDANSAGGAVVNASLTGTYTVGADGRGTATMTDSSGAHTFRFVLTSSSRGQLIQFDSGAVTSGYIRLQDQTAIAALSGTFVYSLSGDNAGPSSAVGQMALAGGAITGTQDENNSGTLSQGSLGIVGSYAIAAAGRGTATITNGSGTAHYALYVIDASSFALLDIDSSGFRTAGTAFAQTGAPFSNASLSSSAYFVGGNSVPGNKPIAQAGRFDATAAGRFSNAVFDLNNAGVVSSNTPFAGGASFSVAANGRTTISTGTSTFIAWLASSKLGVIMEAESVASPVATGLLLQQQTGFQSVTGGYGFVAAGANSGGASAQAIDGQVTTQGFGVLSGTLDLNVAGTQPQVNAVISGNLTLGGGGRAVGSLTGSINNSAITSANYAFYFVSPDRFLLITADGSLVLGGTAERQCADCQF